MINPSAVIGPEMQRQLMSRLGGNQLFQRAQEMARGKSPEELEQVANNLCKQRGIDINAAYQQFRQYGQNGFGLLR